MTKEIAPDALPQLFKMNPGLAYLNPLNNDPRFHAAAAEVPGYRKLTDGWRNIESQSTDDQKIPRYGDGVGRAYTNILAGASAVDEADELWQIEEHAKELFRAAELVDGARVVLDSNAREWLRERGPAIGKVMARSLNEAVEKGKPLFRGPLKQVRTSDDLVDYPDAARAWAASISLAAEFTSIAATVERLAAVGSEMYRIPWEFSWLFRDYAKAWPLFYLRIGFNITDPQNGSYYGPVEQDIPWWTDMDRATMYRTIAERELVLWAPTPDQLQSANKRIDTQSEAARLERNEAEIQSGRDNLDPIIAQPSSYSRAPFTV